MSVTFEIVQTYQEVFQNHKSLITIMIFSFTEKENPF